jgi:hypothetical protein
MCGRPDFWNRCMSIVPMSRCDNMSVKLGLKTCIRIPPMEKEIRNRAEPSEAYGRHRASAHGYGEEPWVSGGALPTLSSRRHEHFVRFFVLKTWVRQPTQLCENKLLSSYQIMLLRMSVMFCDLQKGTS